MKVKSVLSLDCCPFQYLFVDKSNKLIFTTTDDCSTFFRRQVSFSPDEILFHPSNERIVLAYDRTSAVKKVSISQEHWYSVYNFYA